MRVPRDEGNPTAVCLALGFRIKMKRDSESREHLSLLVSSSCVSSPPGGRLDPGGSSGQNGNGRKEEKVIAKHQIQ